MAAKDKKDKKPKTDKKDRKDSSPLGNRTLWIALAVLAVLAAVLWYLNRQGYLRRWFPARSASSSRRFAQQPQYDVSPSAPPYEGF